MPPIHIEPALRQAVLPFILLLCFSAGPAQGQSQDEAGDPPEIVMGERLFLETRFAQFFKKSLDQGGTANDPLPTGDPVMDGTTTTGEPLPGPFAGRSMNCRACHLVDEQLDRANGGMRTYTDFARRSPVPAREDGAITAPRNSPPLVNATLPRTGGLLLHFDAEFTSTAELVKATFAGRNFGWLPGERNQAIAHLARVIRQDDGSGPLAADFGNLPYSVVLTGTDPSIPVEFRLPEQFRIPVATATDAEIFDAVARLVSAYTEGLVFSQDDNGAFHLSPYDVFLEINGLPRKPAPKESPLAYSRRLLHLIEGLDGHGRLRWVIARPTPQMRRHHRRASFVQHNPHTDDGAFQFHDQPFAFGASELQGLKIFFAESPPVLGSAEAMKRGRVGNCIACHQAPNFTDFRVHNTGTAQAEYDRIHGDGQFAALPIPQLEERNAQHDAYLPATEQHPHALEPFRSIPSPADPRRTDLGLWNIFANPDFPGPQQQIRRLVCTNELLSTLPAAAVALSERTDEALDGLVASPAFAERCHPNRLLPRSIALFKTPGLRDLGHSAPYMHTGQFDTLEDIVDFYRTSSNLQRAGRLRNGAPELAGIRLTEQDVAHVTAFLKALNEDYE